MKKILFVLLATLLIASFAYAEQSAQTYSGNSLISYREQQVFIDAYNGSGSSISSNYVVVLDTSTSDIASASSLGTYITTTTATNSELVLGVTENTIANGAVGRVCVRGPHKCYLTTAPTALGASLTTAGTAGAGYQNLNAAQGGIFGVALTITAVGPNDKGAVLSSPGILAEGNNNYWIWVGGPGK